MARKIDRLLNKKGWTGVEVGKALVASIIHDIRHQSEPDYKPLFSQSDFEKMESSLNTERDYLAYGVYRDLYSGLIDAYNRGQGLYQQFYNGYYRYVMHLKGAMQSEKVLADTKNYPLIMTEEQYQKAEAETLEYKKTFGESFYSLLFNLLEDFLDALDAENTAQIPANILKAIEATKEEKAKDQPILRSYNEIYGLGYYQLPDGTRSDSFEGDGWQEKLKEEYLKTHKLRINGKPASFEDTMLHYNTERRLKGYELFFKGEDAIRAEYEERTGKKLPEYEAGELLEALEDTIDQIGRKPYSPLREQLKELYEEESPAKWHYYTEAPEGLTQYDLLDAIIDVSRYEDTDKKQHLKDFKKYYPALYEALETYIRESVPKAKSLKANQLYKEFIGWGELAEANIGKYAEMLQPASSDIIQYLQRQGLKFSDSRRARLRGIAVLKQPRSYQLDEQGNYKEESNPLDRLDSLDSIAENSNTRIKIDGLQNNLLKPALKFLYGFNALIRIIGAVYDISGIEVAEFDTSTFESQIEGFNSLLYCFYYSVYGDAEEKARKRELIKDIFSPIDAESLKPTEEAIEAVTAELDRLGFSTEARKKLKKFDALIERLCERGL